MKNLIKKLKLRKIKCGKNVSFGYGVQILPGVNVGDGAVFTKNVESYIVVAGVSARKIGERK